MHVPLRDQLCWICNRRRGGDHGAAGHRWARLDRVTVRPRGGVRLWMAKFADGSRVFLDSRGLMHLMSADRQIPQVSVVLVADGESAGWCANHQVFGHTYFHGPDVGNRVSPTTVFRQAIQPFVGRLP